MFMLVNNNIYWLWWNHVNKTVKCVKIWTKSFYFTTEQSEDEPPEETVTLMGFIHAWRVICMFIWTRGIRQKHADHVNPELCCFLMWIFRCSIRSDVESDWIQMISWSPRWIPSPNEDLNSAPDWSVDH